MLFIMNSSEFLSGSNTCSSVISLAASAVARLKSLLYPT
ncbi:Phage portal protein, pbsx [Bacillus cereus 95/8201]|nr:Phage portal protein, pbsx [Bacillus cereus 95/8201]